MDVTEQQLSAWEALAAEIVVLGDSNEAKRLIKEGLPALCKEVRRLRKELEARKDDAKHEAWERDEAI